MASDTPETRKELAAAWRAVFERLTGSGYPRSAVVETMMVAALADLDDLHGVSGASDFIVKARSQRGREGGPKKSD